MSTENAASTTLPTSNLGQGENYIVCDVPGRESLRIDFSQSHEGSVDQFCELAVPKPANHTDEAIGIVAIAAGTALVGTLALRWAKDHLVYRSSSVR